MINFPELFDIYPAVNSPRCAQARCLLRAECGPTQFAIIYLCDSNFAGAITFAPQFDGICMISVNDARDLLTARIKIT